MSRYCGGCSGEGRHWRWCPNVVGLSASQFGRMAAEAEDLGDRIGANEAGVANLAYTLSERLHAIARQRASEYMEHHGTHH